MCVYVCGRGVFDCSCVYLCREATGKNVVQHSLLENP